MKRNKILSLILVAALAIGATGCTKKTETSEAGKKAEDNGKKVVNVAYQNNAFPLAYEDESGKLTGYEIEVMKILDEKLEDYEFKFINAGTQEAEYTGLTTGKYDIALSNAFYTDERDKAYNLPKNPIGASLVGLVLPKDNKDVKGFDDVAKKKLSLAPILAGDGLYYVVYKYNQEHQGAEIKLDATDDANAFMNSIGWVADGRYDTAVWPKNYYEQIVTDKKGDLHDYDAKLKFVECRSVHTYPVIKKDLTELAEVVDKGLGEIKETGKMNELSKQFYGYDAFAYDSSN
ncbi:MAG: transporter substrate-binding domain-containing protein [Eubacterium sp.]|nr:transporter substrate-binding domain-containing protein [Eubacterium sp.]